MRTTLIPLALFLFAACGDNDEPPDAGWHPERHVLVWLDPAADLPLESLLDGCGRWDELGVGCEPARSERESDVQVYAETSECDPDGDGSYVLAYAVCCGTVVFRSECFRDERGRYDREGLAIVMAHEVGHQFGMWWHVARGCGGSPPTHPGGEPVCGKAVMNPYFDRSVAHPNEVDTLAFDLRDPRLSVVDERNHHADDEDLMDGATCVYRRRGRGK